MPIHIHRIEEKKLEVSGPEHKLGTNGKVGSTVKEHAETTDHDIHPNYASTLEMALKTKGKRLFLESYIHS